MKRIPPNGATARSRSLRANMTDAERAMWKLLRSVFPEWRFRRQVPIRQYIVDFASHRARLVIEVDGGQHDEATDAPRTAIIEADGYRVLRFWNSDVLDNIEGVATQLAVVLDEISPPPNPPPSRGRAKRRATTTLSSPSMGEAARLGSLRVSRSGGGEGAP